MTDGADRLPAWWPVLRSEWTKFRTVRGWIGGLVLAGVLTVALTYLGANGSHSGTCLPAPGGQESCVIGSPEVPTGPDGQAVADSYYFVAKPLPGAGSLTARVVSLTGRISTNAPDVAPSLSATTPGLAPWTKAGLLLTPTPRPGSAYAAVMATAAHGVRWQYDYVHDRAGAPQAVTSGPVWLRLARRGSHIDGYDSADGLHWTTIGTTSLPGSASTVYVGLFVTSPVSYQSAGGGEATLATATFDRVSLSGVARSTPWSGRRVGSSPDLYPAFAVGSYRQAAGAFTVTGSGDIAAAVAIGSLGPDTPGDKLNLGLVVGLIVLVVIATGFIASEYRRHLVRSSFAATPRRGRVVVGKAVVVAAVALVMGAVAAWVAVVLSDHVLRANGNYLYPTAAATMARIIFGAAAVTALAAAATVGLGAVLRRSAPTVAAGIVAFILPYVLGAALGGGAQQWLFRVTPAAGFAVLGSLPRSPVVSYPYTLANGYYPLGPWAGLAVVGAYAVVALLVATAVVRRRDA